MKKLQLYLQLFSWKTLPRSLFKNLQYFFVNSMWDILGRINLLLYFLFTVLSPSYLKVFFDSCVLASNLCGGWASLGAWLLPWKHRQWLFLLSIDLSSLKVLVIFYLVISMFFFVHSFQCCSIRDKQVSLSQFIHLLGLEWLYGLINLF